MLEFTILKDCSLICNVAAFLNVTFHILLDFLLLVDLIGHFHRFPTVRRIIAQDAQQNSNKLMTRLKINRVKS